MIRQGVESQHIITTAPESPPPTGCKPQMLYRAYRGDPTFINSDFFPKLPADSWAAVLENLYKHKKEKIAAQLIEFLIKKGSDGTSNDAVGLITAASSLIQLGKSHEGQQLLKAVPNSLHTRHFLFFFGTLITLGLKFPEANKAIENFLVRFSLLEEEKNRPKLIEQLLVLAPEKQAVYREALPWMKDQPDATTVQWNKVLENATSMRAFVLSGDRTSTVCQLFDKMLERTPSGTFPDFIRWYGGIFLSKENVILDNLEYLTKDRLELFCKILLDGDNGKYIDRSQDTPLFYCLRSRTNALMEALEKSSHKLPSDFLKQLPLILLGGKNGELYDKDRQSPLLLGLSKGNTALVDSIARLVPPSHGDLIFRELERWTPPEKKEDSDKDNKIIVPWLIGWNHTGAFNPEYLIEAANHSSKKTKSNFFKIFILGDKAPKEASAMSNLWITTSVGAGSIALLDWTIKNRENLPKSASTDLLNLLQDFPIKGSYNCRPPLSAAISNGKMEVFDWILNNKGFFREELIERLFLNLLEPTQATSWLHSISPIHIASSTGRNEIFEWIIAHADQLPPQLSIRNIFNFCITPHKEEQYSWTRSFVIRAKILCHSLLLKAARHKIQYPKKLFSWSIDYGLRGHTPLYEACYHEKRALLDLFLKYRDQLPKNWSTQLFNALTFEHDKVFQKRNFYQCPLHQVCQDRKWTILNWLVENRDVFQPRTIPRLIEIIIGDYNGRLWKMISDQPPILALIKEIGSDKNKAIAKFRSFAELLTNEELKALCYGVIGYREEFLTFKGESVLQRAYDTTLLNCFISVKDRLPKIFFEDLYNVSLGRERYLSDLHIKAPKRLSSNCLLENAIAIDSIEFLDWMVDNSDLWPEDPEKAIISILQYEPGYETRTGLGRTPLQLAISFQSVKVIQWWIDRSTLGQREKISMVISILFGGENNEYIDKNGQRPIDVILNKDRGYRDREKRLINLLDKYTSDIPAETLSKLVELFISEDGKVTFATEKKVEIDEFGSKFFIFWLLRYTDKLNSQAQIRLLKLASDKSNLKDAFCRHSFTTVVSPLNFLDWLIANRATVGEELYKEVFYSVFGIQSENRLKKAKASENEECLASNMLSILNDKESKRAFEQWLLNSIDRIALSEITTVASAMLVEDLYYLDPLAVAQLLPTHISIISSLSSYTDRDKRQRYSYFKNLLFLDRAPNLTHEDHLASVFSNLLSIFSGQTPYFDDQFVEQIKENAGNSKHTERAAKNIRALVTIVAMFSNEVASNNEEFQRILISNEINSLILDLLTFRNAHKRDKTCCSNLVDDLNLVLSRRLQGLFERDAGNAIKLVPDLIKDFSKQITAPLNTKNGKSVGSEQLSLSLLSSRFQNLSDWLRSSALWHRADRACPLQPFYYEDTWGALFPGEVEVGEFRAKCLTTTSDLKKQGIDLKLCVGSYSDRCVSGQSIIISFIDSTDNPATTLELRRDPDGTIKIGDAKFSEAQYYSASNHTPMIEAIEAKDILLHQLVTGKIKSTPATASIKSSVTASCLTDSERNSRYPDELAPTMMIAHWEFAYDMPGLSRQLYQHFEAGAAILGSYGATDWNGLSLPSRFLN